jgi:hypothetical protein
MMAVPVFLPADPSIDKPEIPAVDRTQPFRSEREFLLRETHSGNGWLSPLIHLALLAMCALWAAAFTTAVRHLSRGDTGEPHPVDPRRAQPLVAHSSGST